MKNNAIIELKKMCKEYEVPAEKLNDWIATWVAKHTVTHDISKLQMLSTFLSPDDLIADFQIRMQKELNVLFHDFIREDYQDSIHLRLEVLTLRKEL